MKLVKRRFRLFSGITFGLIGAFFFFGSLIGGLLKLDPVRPWIAAGEFGGVGFLILIAGTAMCFEKQ